MELHSEPCFTSIDFVVEKLTDVALGSDIMGASLRDFAQLKLSGKAAGLEGLRRDLGKRFEKSPRKKPDMDVAAG